MCFIVSFYSQLETMLEQLQEKDEELCRAKDALHHEQVPRSQVRTGSSQGRSTIKFSVWAAIVIKSCSGEDGIIGGWGSLTLHFSHSLHKNHICKQFGLSAEGVGWVECANWGKWWKILIAQDWEEELRTVAELIRQKTKIHCILLGKNEFILQNKQMWMFEFSMQ